MRRDSTPLSFDTDTGKTYVSNFILIIQEIWFNKQQQFIHTLIMTTLLKTLRRYLGNVYDVISAKVDNQDTCT